MCGKNKMKNPAKVLGRCWVGKESQCTVNGWSAKMACSTAACCHRHPRACAASVVMDVPPAHPHVTYLAFEGRDASVADEVGLSAYSVQRMAPGTAVTVLTDSWRMADQLSMRVPKHVKVTIIDHRTTASYFRRVGLVKMAHHSGLGGYSKLIVDKLLPSDLNATIVLDSDTLLVDDILPVWRLRERFFRQGALLMAKRITSGGACLKGQRINSGVLLLDLERMRRTNWTDVLLERIAWLGRGNVPARLCGKMVRNRSTLAAGDQELLSYGCLQAGKGTCAALPHGMHQDKCDGIEGGSRAVILHFNCRGSVPGDCPLSGPCRALVHDFQASGMALQTATSMRSKWRSHHL